jgi:hypothetical protein
LTNILVIFANIGQLMGDILALISVAGSIFMLFIRSGRWSQFVELGIFALILGALGQIAMAVLHYNLDSIGVFQMTPAQVDGLLLISAIMIFARNLLIRLR